MVHPIEAIDGEQCRCVAVYRLECARAVLRSAVQFHVERTSTALRWEGVDGFEPPMSDVDVLGEELFGNGQVRRVCA